MRKFSGALVASIWCFHCHGPGSIPGWETEVPQATECGQKKKKKMMNLNFYFPPNNGKKTDQIPGKNKMSACRQMQAFLNWNIVK